jgi:hypothetical protein
MPGTFSENLNAGRLQADLLESVGQHGTNRLRAGALTERVRAEQRDPEVHHAVLRKADGRFLSEVILNKLVADSG